MDKDLSGRWLLLRALGVIVVPVPGLNLDAFWVSDHNVSDHDIALVKAGLDPAALADAADWLLRQRTESLPPA